MVFLSASSLPDFAQFPFLSSSLGRLAHFGNVPFPGGMKALSPLPAEQRTGFSYPFILRVYGTVPWFLFFFCSRTPFLVFGIVLGGPLLITCVRDEFPSSSKAAIYCLLFSTSEFGSSHTTRCSSPILSLLLFSSY